MYLPKYTITTTILRNVSLIEAAREVVENAALVPAWEAQFRRDAVLRTVHYGTHLEGNTLSREQVDRVIEENPSSTDDGLSPDKTGVLAKERDIQEVLNYREVLRYIDASGVPVEGSYGRVRTEFVPYTLESLCEIHRLVSHRILPESEQGLIRNVGVVIRNKRTSEIIFRPPPAPVIRFQLADFFEWINSTVSRRDEHPVLRAGIAHWELARIHPFTDGNGRTARALTLLVLFQEGYDVKRFFSIEQYYDQNPMDYYRSLQEVGKRNDGDVTSWLEYFTDGLAIELSRIKDRVVKLSRDLRLKGKLGRQIALSERQIKLLEYMETNNGILTTRELSRVYPMVSRDTILRDMNDLVEKALVRKVGITKGARYLLNE